MSRFKELLSEQTSLQDRLKKINEEFTEVAKEEFKVWAKDLFAKYPPLEYITWTQYTPYFNDGNPCYFRSSHDCYSLNSEECEEINDEGFTPEEIKNAQEDIDKFLGNFDSDDMERLFGDHCRVTITANGVDVEEYDSHY